MKKKIVLDNGMEIEYTDALLESIMKMSNKSEKSAISEKEIADFFKSALEGAISKGYGVVEN